MPTISSNEIRNGTVLEVDGKLWSVLWFQHHKPGKGNTVIRLKLKDLRSGSIIERTINSDMKVESPVVERTDMSYLYNDGTHYVFMHQTTYDQIEVSPEEMGDAANYLVEGLVVSVALFEGRPISIELPASVELQITTCEPGIKGDRVSGATKPATLATGLVVQVPLFVEAGETIKVDTRTGEYLTRVS